MEDQGKLIKIDEDIYGVAFGNVLDITDIEPQILGSIKFMQEAISVAKEENSYVSYGKLCLF